MLEELCRNPFYSMCMDATAVPRVHLKGTPKPQPIVGNGYFNELSGFTHYSILPLHQRFRKGPTYTSLSMAWQWFTENSKRLIDAYIREKHDNDLIKAIRASGTFDEAFDDFLNFFAERRSQYMAETQQLIDAQKKNLAAIGKIPQSHGGVANLLKVLTKTMERQGSSIKTIAKVQYAICLQAGIFIPEEFIADVLVASNIADEEGKEGASDV